MAVIKASAVTYSDTVSKLGATNVQDAVVKLAAKSAAQSDLLASLAARLAKLEVPPSPPVPAPVPTPPPTVPATPNPPQQDAKGFTSFAPSPDTRIVYVSSSAGSDGERGLSTGQPVASLARGLSLIRSGYPDWLLLKKGDPPWLNQSIALGSVSGRSKNEPVLISSWGVGATMPQIKIPAYNSGVGSLLSDYIAITDIDFYAHTKDPNSPTFIASATKEQDDVSGAYFVNYVPLNSLLIEGCRFRFCKFGIIVQAVNANSGTLTFRRNLVADNYSRYGDSSGIYVENIANFINHENTYDHNGWNETVPVVGNPPQYRNHPYYAHASVLTTDAVGNIIARPCGSVAQRSGGHATGNLFVRSPMAIGLGAPRAGTNTMTFNVVLEGCDPPNGEQPLGQGLIASTVDANGGFVSVGTTEINNNIVAHSATTQTPPYNSVALDIAAQTTKAKVISNIVYRWKDANNVSIRDQNGSNTITPNEIDGTGYLDPNRSVGSYNATLGGTATLAAFLAEARKQSKDNWRVAYTADAVNKYIRAGFGR